MTIIINTSEKTIEVQGVYPVVEVIEKINELLASGIIDKTYTSKQVFYNVSYPVYPVYPQYPIITYRSF